jgi:hypothetical protein
MSFKFHTFRLSLFTYFGGSIRLRAAAAVDGKVWPNIS